MPNVIIRYYEELNDFLPEDMRKRDIEVPFKDRRSVKDVIESMGVPHVEVDIILVNGASVDFSYIVNDNDRISVFPVFGSLDIPGVTRLTLSPLDDTRFVLDVHLRKLARTMRLLGFDADFEDDRDDDMLAVIAATENRILLTCDRRLLMRKIVPRGIIVRSRDPEQQIIEVTGRLRLRNMVNPLTRCVECNGLIRDADMNSLEFTLVKNDIPEGVISWCTEYFICNSCGRIYWHGSHYDKLKVKVNRILKSIDSNQKKHKLKK
ncbi:MAG TPA: Mut7-C RNAse domain-containing protein [Spirochaetota bacterium]|nr:Mut7-C RNAse domain-containing protein [Spirochaetota bacterium]